MIAHYDEALLRKHIDAFRTWIDAKSPIFVILSMIGTTICAIMIWLLMSRLLHVTYLSYKNSTIGFWDYYLHTPPIWKDYWGMTIIQLLLYSLRAIYLHKRLTTIPVTTTPII